MLSQYLSRIPPYETTQYYILVGFCSMFGCRVTFEPSSDFAQSVLCISCDGVTVYDSRDVLWIAHKNGIESMDCASFVRQELFDTCVVFLESKGVTVNYTVMYKIHDIEELRLNSIVVNSVVFECTLISRALADYVTYIRSLTTLEEYDQETTRYIIEMLQ